MVELVDTLLNVSRIELGTFKVEPTPTDVIALARSVLDEQRPKIEKKKLTVAKEFSPSVQICSTDPKLLRIIFQNLLSNSVEYTPPRGKIEFAISVESKSSRKTLLVKVSDKGYGIPKNQQGQIFTKLFRADNVRDKDTDGTGLGLYIVKSIIENLGGKIWFESPARSKLGSRKAAAGKGNNPGTTFYVPLPIS